MGKMIAGRPQAAVLIGIFALFVNSTMFTVFTPGLDTLAKAFSSTPADLIFLSNSITGLAVVPFSVVGGVLAEKIGYKPLAVIGTVLAVVAGAAPFFLTADSSFWLVIASRTIVGIGVGLVNPLGGALVMRLFSGPARARYLGYGNLFFMVGGVVFQTLGGVFASISWNTFFLANLFGLVPLALTLLLVPKMDAGFFESLNASNSSDDQEQEDADQGNSKGRFLKIGFAACGFILFYLIIAVIDVVAPITSSMICDERGFGGAVVAAMAANTWLVGGAVTSVVFGSLYRVLGKKLLAVFCALACIGFFVMFGSTSSAPLYFSGMALGALADSGIFLFCQNAAAEAAGKQGSGVVAGLMMAAMNLGAFFAGYYITFSSEALSVYQSSAPLLVTGVILVALVVIAIAVAIFSKKKMTP